MFLSEIITSWNWLHEPEPCQLISYAPDLMSSPSAEELKKHKVQVKCVSDKRKMHMYLWHIHGAE